MTPYRRTPGGRLMLLSIGLFFLAFGNGVLISDPDLSMKIFCLLLMVSVTNVIFAVTLSFSQSSSDSHAGKFISSLCVFPFLAWLLGPELITGLWGPSAMRTACLVLGIIGLLLASDPRGSEVKGQTPVESH